MAKVLSCSYVDYSGSVCDITVADNHNLFVCDEISQDSVLAHNCLDENMKALVKCRTPTSGKVGAYSLAWMCAWYNCDFYATNPFSKDQRATIETRSLDEPGLTEYCGMDAQTAFAIHDAQIERATATLVAHKSYKDRYKKFIVAQMSNLVQIESVMEHRGDQLDIPYLMKLKDRNGPITVLKKEIANKFKNFPEVRKANAILAKRAGIPTKGLFGGTPWIFGHSKPAHKQLLFIDVMGLAPVALGKSGAPKIDKEFQALYKDKPPVAVFTQLAQIGTLESTYVSGFFKKFKTDIDMRTDGRMRPSYGFTGTVTGRSNSYDPNLQNIPQRGKFAKFIKRMFVAPRGCLILKMDYSAHEVRVWGIVAGDDLLCSLFINGRWLRQQYRKTGKQAYKTLMDTKGDIHKVNCIAGSSLVATDRGILPIASLGTKGVEPLSVKTRTHGGVSTTSHWKASGEARCLRIVTELGNEVTVTPDHRVAIWDDGVGELAWKQAKDVREDDLMLLAPSGVLRKTKLDLQVPTFDLHHNAQELSKIPRYMTTDLAWLIGCIVSEGSTGAYTSGSFVIFSNTDRKLVDLYVERFANVFGTDLEITYEEAGKERVIDGVATTSRKTQYGVRMSSTHLLQLFNYLGLYVETGRVNGLVASHRKVVPWSILQADAECQRAFMAAYLECDGNIENTSGILRWFSVSKELISQFRTMLNAHGAFPATGAWRTVAALTLTGVDSNTLWPKLAPYMVSKKLVVKERRTNSGIPAKYWQDLLASRVSSNGRFAETDTGCEVLLAGHTNYFIKVQSLSPEIVIKHKDYLRKISKRGYAKLIAANKAGYRFSRVASVEDAGKHAVYDLTMTGANPSFVANGLIVHNCEVFFKVEAKDVTAEQRNSVKSIVFGAIYGRGPKAIAAQAGAPVETIKEVLKAFFERFKKASDWLDYAKGHAVKNGHMYSPIWRMRNMFTQMYGIQNLVAATERRGCNAPIQGFAADIGHTAATLYQHHIERVVKMFDLDTKAIPRAGVNTFVHDAIKTDAPYEYLLACLQVLQWCATTGVMEYYKVHWGVKFHVEVEVEFEFAAHDDAHWKYDWHDGNGQTLDKGKVVGGGLQFCIRKALEDQKEVYSDLDIDAIEKQVWAMRKNKPLMTYLDKNYPFLADWPDAKHIDVNSKSFKTGLGRLVKETEREEALAA